MDLNERLAARRKELAEEERAREEAEKLRLMAEAEAVRKAEQATAAAAPRPPNPLAQRAVAKKTVEIDLNAQVFEQAMARTTKPQWAIFCVLAVLTVIGLVKDPLMACFWALCALGYAFITVSAHVDDIKKSGNKE